MAVNLHQPSVYALFDACASPLLTFGVSGAVTYANAAARQHPGRPVEAMGGNAVVKALIADAILGKLKLPYKAEVELADRQRLHGQFMAGPAGLDIAFLGAVAEGGAPAGSAPAHMELKDIMELLRDEMLPPLQHFATQLKALPRLPMGSAIDHAEQELSQRLQRLVDLTTVFGDDVLALDDRIELQPLLRAICDELSPRSTKTAVRFELVDPGEALPPIYGNAKLVRRAFHECLYNAMVHSRKEVSVRDTVTVEIRFTLSGEHVLVSVRNRGVTAVRVAGTVEVLPFAATSRTAPPGTVPRLGLPLVKRIVALHGGNLRFGAVGDDTVQILIEFPTGAPHRGGARLDIEQAQRYAQDLAKLLSRKKKETA